MNTVTLQVPMDKNLRDAASSAAREQGLSSLQEAIRVYLTKLANRQVGIGIIKESVTQLSPKNESRYLHMQADFKSGRHVYHATDADDFLRQLDS